MKDECITGVITAIRHRADPPYIRIKLLGSKNTMPIYISPVNWGNVWVDGLITVTGIPEMARPVVRKGKRYPPKLKAIYVNSVQRWPGRNNSGSGG